MNSQFAILDLGTPQLILILVIALVLFGGKRLPELSKSLSSSIRELRKGFTEDNEKPKAENNQETR
jgi:sec-independent protein translocase protein TatA